MCVTDWMASAAPISPCLQPVLTLLSRRIAGMSGPLPSSPHPHPPLSLSPSFLLLCLHLSRSISLSRLVSLSPALHLSHVTERGGDQWLYCLSFLEQPALPHPTSVCVRARHWPSPIRKPSVETSRVGAGGGGWGIGRASWWVRG